MIVHESQGDWADQLWATEQKTKRYRYWSMLRSAKNEFVELTQHAPAEFDVDDGAFYYYLKQNYGLQVATIDSKITSDYAVIDEKKYLLFLLKFSQ